MRYIDLNLIQVGKERQRREFDPDRMAELIDSIEKHGLLHPIVVRGDNVLVAGERRLRAISHLVDLGQQVRFNNETLPLGAVPIVGLGELSPLDAEEAELSENIHRVDLSWQERAQAIARLGKLRQEQAAATGAPAPTIKALAEEVYEPKRDGFAQSGAYAENLISETLLVARNLDDADVSKAKTMKEAVKILKRKDEAARRERLAESIGSTFSARDHQLINADCFDWMRKAPRAHFDVICTDPPYGIDASEFGNSGGRLTQQVHIYEDSPEKMADLVHDCVDLWTQITKPQAHAYVCCDIDFFHLWRDTFTAFGWRPHRTPLVNFKRDGSRVPWPEHGPQRKYELVLYAERGGKRVTRIYPDVIETKGDENLGHGAQKPVGLYLDLLRRSISPGDRVLDCFAGTGPVLAAAHELKCYATAIELSPEFYAVAAERLGSLK